MERIIHFIKSLIKHYLVGDWQLWLIYLGLAAIGVLAVYSSSFSMAYREAGGDTERYLFLHLRSVLVGLGAVLFTCRFNYRWLTHVAELLLWLGIPLLIYTNLRGETIGEASRWIRIMGFSFQPSDFIKFVLIVNIALLLAQKQNVAKEEYSFQSLSKAIFWTAGYCLALANSGFSTAVLLGMTCFAVFWVGRVPRKFLVRMGLFVGFGLAFMLVLGLAASSMGMKFGRAEVVIDRIESFGKDSFGAAWDINRDGKVGGNVSGTSDQRLFSLAAIANGGMAGAGPGHGVHRYKLSESFSDLIFSVIVEEYGVIGAIIVISLYLWLLWKGLKNIQNTYRAFGGLLSIGLTLSIVIQAFFHILVNVGFVPITGQTLPLVSWGGSSFLFTSIMFGIVIAISRGEEDEIRTARRRK